MKIGILGARGRMGSLVVDAVFADSGCELTGATVRPGSDDEGRDLGELTNGSSVGVAVVSDPAPVFTASDIVIDFSKANLAPTHVALGKEHGVPMVVGTTGFDMTELAAVYEAAESIPVVLAANTSLGITVLLDVVERVAATLDQKFDIEISEIHHRNKVDAPSGAALILDEAAARGRGMEIEHIADLDRNGHTGVRALGHIGFSSLRGGDVVGEHTVTFAGAGERIEVTHRCTPCKESG